MIEKAEGLGLKFGQAYLANFRACFNSTLNNSMTLLYRVAGQHVRPIGSHPRDGEAIHQAALDRRNLASCHYGAANLAASLAQPDALPVVTTTRVSRGVACEDPVSYRH
jgi:hypothetical protein